MSPSTDDRIEALVGGFADCRVVVIGDMMLDEYWWGNVERISPEAPVPVVSVERTSAKLGGAANVARNIKTLGGMPSLIGVTGDDRGREQLLERLRRSEMDGDGLVIDGNRPTTVKTRVVAHSQQVVRADSESIDEISGDVADALIERVAASLEDAHGVVISDYGKGVITSSLLERVIATAKSAGKFVAVDPKDTHFFSYRGVTTLTPNHHEAGFVAGRRIRDEQTLREVGFDLLRRLAAESLLVTRGEKGMALFEAPDRVTLIPTAATDVYDVTGAGDTVIATVAIVLAAGGTMVEAARIANVAAGLVIREIGTAAVERETLLNALSAGVESTVC